MYKPYWGLVEHLFINLFPDSFFIAHCHKCDDDIEYYVNLTVYIKNIV